MVLHRCMYVAIHTLLPLAAILHSDPPAALDDFTPSERRRPSVKEAHCFIGKRPCSWPCKGYGIWLSQVLIKLFDVDTYWEHHQFFYDSREVFLGRSLNAIFVVADGS